VSNPVLGVHVGTTGDTTAPLTTTTGSVLIVDCETYNASAITGIVGLINGVADGNTWTPQGTIISGSDANYKSLRFYCENANGGANHTFQCVHTGGVSVGIMVHEFQNVPTTAAVVFAPNGNVETHNDSTPYLTDDTGTLAQADCAVFVCSHNYTTSGGPETHTWNNGFTGIESKTNPASWTAASAYKLPGVTTAQQGSLTCGGAGTQDTLMYITVINGASGGGSTAPPGIAEETDTAYAPGAQHVAPPGNATEYVQAFSLGTQHVAPPGIAAEIDTAFARPSPGASPGIASETDTAYSLGTTHQAPPGIASETDTAFARAAPGQTPPGIASETDTAYSLGTTHQAAPGIASETDTAYSLGTTHQAPPGIATETDTAHGGSSHAPPGIATETDTAYALSSGYQRPASGPRNRTVYEPVRMRTITRSGMALSPKHHEATHWFFFPFVLLEDDTIASFAADGITQDEGDCVIEDIGIEGNQASCRVSGGTPGTSVVLRAECTTTLGETLQLVGQFLVV
jgi:hypothetical protein